MLKLPKTTEISKALPKKAIFDRFKPSPENRRLFDEQVNRMSIVHEISPQTTAIKEGEDVSAVYVILVTLKTAECSKKNIALLRACAKTGKAAGQFIEVMACEGGCITGPSTHNDIVSGRRQLAQELLKRKESYETMDR